MNMSTTIKYEDKPLRALRRAFWLAVTRRASRLYRKEYGRWPKTT